MEIKLNREEILCLIENIGDVAIMLGNHYIDVEVKNQNEITKYILASASHQTNNIIHAVHITIYLGNGRITGLSFEPKI